MKITYTQNPLDTIVELEPHEVELFRLKLKIEIYEDKMFSAHYALHTTLDTEKAKEEAMKELDPNKWCTDEMSLVDARVEELLQHYLEELKSSHVGDCTAFPMSCSKCRAEQLLGIDTLKPYPGKSVLHVINLAFSYKEGEEFKTRDLAGAIEWLKAGGETRAKALEYLLSYHNTHFPE